METNAHAERGHPVEIKFYNFTLNIVYVPTALPGLYW